MKRNKKYQLQLALSACLAMTAGNALAAEEQPEAPDTSNWVCKLCVVPYGWHGGAEFGLLYVDDPTPKFADYRGFDEDGVALDLGGQGRYIGENGHYLDYYARNLAHDSRVVDIEGGKQGFYEFRGGYKEIPRYQGHGTFTPFQGVGTDNLTLPGNWSPSPDAPLEYADLESKRKISAAGFTFKAFSRWRADVDFERQEKDGTKATSGGVFLLNVVHWPSPLKHTTDRFDASIEYAGRMLQIRGEFMGSEFDNGYSSVTWENPIAVGFGDDLSRTALEPGNEYQQFSLVGAIRVTDWLRFSGKVSSGEAKQNDPFLPYSVNPDYEDRPLPRESLNGKLETSVYNLSGRLLLELSRGLDLTATYKSSERKNKTPVDTYEPVMFEIFPGSARSNRPYSYERSQGTVELRYRPTYRLRLNAGYRSEEVDRTYQEVRTTDEDGFFGEVQWAPFDLVDVRLRLEDMERDASISEQQGNYDRAENPLMRKFNMANRDRQRSTVEVDLNPTDRMGISFSAWSTDDDYSESVVGLTSSEETAVSIDFNYALGEYGQLYAFFTDETIKSAMAGADGAGATPWTSNSEDSITTWGFGVSGRIAEKWQYGVDYVSSDSDGEIVTNDGNAEAPFPVLTTELENIRLYVDYEMSEHWGFGLEAFNESYDSADWLVDGIGPYTIDGVLTMGEESPDYDVNVIRVLATYRF